MHPPSGNNLDRFAHTQRYRFAKPLKRSHSESLRFSSSSVMWPQMVIWASVAFVGLFLIKVLRLPVSHAARSVSERVLPSLLMTLKTCENSDSATSSRLSA